MTDHDERVKALAREAADKMADELLKDAKLRYIEGQYLDVDIAIPIIADAIRAALAESEKIVKVRAEGMRYWHAEVKDLKAQLAADAVEALEYIDEAKDAAPKEFVWSGRPLSDIVADMGIQLSTARELLERMAASKVEDLADAKAVILAAHKRLMSPNVTMKEIQGDPIVYAINKMVYSGSENRIALLEGQVAVAREALGFYAEWDAGKHEISPAKAREALAKMDGTRAKETS